MLARRRIERRHELERHLRDDARVVVAEGLEADGDALLRRFRRRSLRERGEGEEQQKRELSHGVEYEDTGPPFRRALQNDNESLPYTTS